jgi:hypothetical protein
MSMARQSGIYSTPENYMQPCEICVNIAEYTTIHLQTYINIPKKHYNILKNIYQHSRDHRIACLTPRGEVDSGTSVLSPAWIHWRVVYHESWWSNTAVRHVRHYVHRLGCTCRQQAKLAIVYHHAVWQNRSTTVNLAPRQQTCYAVVTWLCLVTWMLIDIFQNVVMFFWNVDICL